MSTIEEQQEAVRQRNLKSAYDFGRNQGLKGKEMHKDYVSAMGESPAMDKHITEYMKGYVEGRETYARQTGKARRKHRKGKKYTRKHKRHSKK